MTQVASYCSQCGVKIEPNSKYCSNCGRPNPLAAPVKEEEARPAAAMVGERIGGEKEEESMPTGWNENNKESNNTNNNSNNNYNLPPSRKQKKLLKEKAKLEASLEKVRRKIQQEEAGKRRHGKLKKLIDSKAWYELWIQDKWAKIQQEEQKQQEKYLKKYDPVKYKENKELRKIVMKEQRQRQEAAQQIPGEGKRTAGKILMGLGIFITLIALFSSSVGWQYSILGLIINFIGIALYAAGNREQGRQTSFFGGGFVSTGG
jgi:Fe2+ transport system protein B